MLAWSVEVNELRCVVFAATRPKATWQAVKAYRAAGMGRRFEWPHTQTWREPELDNHSRKREPHCWDEEFLRATL